MPLRSSQAMPLVKVALFILCSTCCAALSEQEGDDCHSESADTCSDEQALLQVRKISLQNSPAAKRSEGEYFWPSGRGRAGSYGLSTLPVNRDISAPTWSWHSPKGRWSTIPVGTSIDEKKNIYLTLADGVNKFSPDGQLLWEYAPPRSPGEEISDAGALFNGAAYFTTTGGRAFALNMDTGKEVWSNSVADSADFNFGQVAARDGVVIVGAAARPVSVPIHTKELANSKVLGLNATDGAILWEFEPDVHVWNFAASLVGDGTFVFQDFEGRAHRNRVSDGSLIWKQGGIPHSWTDGQATVGPNGIVYSVSNFGEPFVSFFTGHTPGGLLSAFRLSDGKLLWNRTTLTAPNDVPVVGRLAGLSSYSVVLPMGLQCLKGQQMHVQAYDAETGHLQWTFNGPALQSIQVAGDQEGAEQRKAAGIRTMTAPNPWGQAMIDSKGVVYVGAETGHFFSLVDANGDGSVDLNDSKEVSVFETGAAFVGSSGPAVAPGLLAVGAIDALHVWRS